MSYLRCAAVTVLPRVPAMRKYSCMRTPARLPPIKRAVAECVCGRHCAAVQQCARERTAACGTVHRVLCKAGAHAASSCSTRFLSASPCSRATTLKNVLKRSSTCASTQSTNGLPPASAAREQSTASPGGREYLWAARGGVGPMRMLHLGLLDELREVLDRLACSRRRRYALVLWRVL